MASPKIGDPCWHVHHGDGLLFEYLTEPYKVRQKYIREYKSAEEVETRLRLFQPVRGTISPPNYWQEAYAKLREAGAMWREADAKRQEPYAKRQEAYAKLREAGAKRQEAYAEWWEADATWWEADAMLQEADAKWQEAYAKLREADAKLAEANAKWRSEPSWQAVLDLHAKECPNCPWNGETIFP